MKETWITNNSSWFNDLASFAYKDMPFLVRGSGNNNRSTGGSFYSCGISGVSGNNQSFRVILIGEMK